MADAILASSGIYQISNSVSGKVYIGSATHLAKRWSAHRNSLNAGKHENRKLQNAWLKYGEAALVFSVVEIVDDVASLLAREQHWIDALDVFKRGYNMCPTAGNCLGRKFSDETRAKMSAKAMGRVMTDSTRAKLSAAGKAVPRSTRDRIALLNTGKKRTLETRVKQSKAQIGKTHSAETKAKLAVLASNMPQEQRDKIAASLRGRPGKQHSAETIAAMSARKKAWWAARKARDIPA